MSNSADNNPANKSGNTFSILFDVLKKHFSNGLRVNDFIELLRFRDLTCQEVGRSIKSEITDEILIKYISRCGTLFEGKIYPVPNEAKRHLKKIIDDYFLSGYQVIFYEEFYSKHRTFLFDNSIISEEMLVSVIKSLIPSINYNLAYCGYTQDNIPDAIEKEIIRVWDESATMDSNQLYDRLTYIPLSRIRNALRQSDRFIYCTENGNYINLGSLDIRNEDCEHISLEVTRCCISDGYIAITDVPLGDLEERNYHLTETELRLAVFHVCLADSFDKKGKIVSPKGQQMDVRSIMCRYFRKVGHCSLSDMETFAEELGATSRPDLILDVGYTALVRTDKESFVPEELVHFDVEAVDEAISRFVTGDYLPLKSFTAFGVFPDCGYAWNLFLLESYCRRFSRMFRYDSLTFNSTNTGAIIRKDNRQGYTEIMVDAVLRAGVDTAAKSVGQFLIEAGYIARNSATVKEIAAEAKTRRERDD